MADKSVVTVARKWNSPMVTAFANIEAIGVQVALSDYVIALATEIGNPTTLLTNAQLLKRMQEAAARVEAELKKATTHVVS